MTRKTLNSFKDAVDNTCYLETKVAYAKGYYGSKPSIHVGIVKRITPEGAWVLPDNKWKHDASNKVKNMPDDMDYRSYWNWRKTPDGKTQVYDWCYVKYHACLKID